MKGKNNLLMDENMIDRMIEESYGDVIAMDVDDMEQLWDEQTDRRFWVKKISEDRLVITEIGGLGKDYPVSLLELNKKIESSNGFAQ